MNDFDWIWPVHTPTRHYKVHEYFAKVESIQLVEFNYVDSCEDTHQ